ncbi:hypothetical protein IW148_005910 [Coemansia sp. RSA 1199]|nr:hypothetical protein IW148_005910 [Coemansia sp. RSA 1199]
MPNYYSSYQTACFALGKIQAELMAILVNKPFVDVLSSGAMKAEFDQLQALFSDNQQLPDPIAAPAQASDAALLNGLKRGVLMLLMGINTALAQPTIEVPLFADHMNALLFRAIAGYFSMDGSQPPTETLDMSKDGSQTD